MPGLIIYGKYGQFYSFILADDKLYRMTIAGLKSEYSVKLCFEKGEVSAEQIDEARDKVSEVVKKLNEGKKINAKEELSDYFN